MAGPTMHIYIGLCLFMFNSATSEMAAINVTAEILNVLDSLIIRLNSIDARLDTFDGTIANLGQGVIVKMELSSPPSNCTNTCPVPDAPSDQTKIPKALMTTDLTASSSERADHGPQCSRLIYPKPSSCYAYAWYAHRPWNAGQYWIQVDLHSVHEVVMVLLQGRIHTRHNPEYTKSFRLATNDENLIFHQSVFSGVEEPFNPVVHSVEPPLIGRHIRLYPLTYQNTPAVRWELYGYKVENE